MKTFGEQNHEHEHSHVHDSVPEKAHQS
jgi:hypothetical protein